MTILWCLAIIYGFFVSGFVVMQYLGISVFILTLMGIGIMHRYKKSAGLPIGRHFYIISGYMLILSPVFAVTTVGVVRFLAGIVLVALMMSLAICERAFVWPSWIGGAFEAFFGSIFKMGSFFSFGMKMTGKKSRQVVHILIGVAMSLPILVVAALLLTSADEIMKGYLRRFFDQFLIEDVGLWYWRILMFLLVCTVTFGYSVWLGREREEKGDIPIRKQSMIPAAVSATVLVLLNMLYLLFAYIQIRFLFFGAIAEGYNHAAYARSGFFELVVLSLLNTAGILVINKFTVPHLFNHISLTVTALCTFMMIASSWYKMYLYEQYYGYTQLRLYVYLILAFMVVFMALITLGIWQTQYRVIEWSILIGLCYFLVISYVNVDRIIVDNNMMRYEEGGELDLYYMITELSEDAIPTLMAYIEKEEKLMVMTQNIADSYYGYSDGDRYIDVDDPYDRLKLYLSDHSIHNDERAFFEFNLRHYLAERALRVAGNEE